MRRSLARLSFLLFAALMVVGLAACGGSSGGSSSSSSGGGGGGKTKIGVLYVGTVDYGGYNQAAYQGELAVKKMANVETIKAENVPENAEAERVMEQMMAQGAKIIFPTSFGHLDPAMKVAAKHPDVTFIHE